MALSSECMSALSVCSSARSDWTVIASVSCPTASDTSTRLIVLGVTGTFSLLYSLKPVMETLTV